MIVPVVVIVPVAVVVVVIMIVVVVVAGVVVSARRAIRGEGESLASAKAQQKVADRSHTPALA